MDEALLLQLGEIEQRHWWFVVRDRIAREVLANLTLGLDVHEVVDVGCGTGAFIDRLAAVFPEAKVVGFEPNEAAREVARREGREVGAALVDDLPLADGSIDVLVALDVLEHCADEAAALAEVRRVLRPGGALLLMVPALPSLWSSHDRVNRHHRRYVRGALCAAVQRAGFEVARCTYFSTVLLPVAYAARFLPEVVGGRAAAGVSVPPGPLNAMLRGTFGLEIRMLRTFDLPLGSSLLLTARSPREA